jgi:hypothetical protein
MHYYLAVLVAVLSSSSVVFAAPLPESEKQVVCQHRPRCQIERVYPAGKTPDGALLRVVKLVLGLSKEEQKQAEEDFMAGCRASDSDKKHGGEEYWLLEEKQPPRKIIALCNNGYGAAGVGEDIVKVENNRFTHTQSGGSASRWESTITLSFSPLRIVYSEGCGFHTLNPAEGEVRWETYDPLMTYAIVKDQTFPDLEEKIGIGCPEKTTHWQWKTKPKPGLLAGLFIPQPSNTSDDQKIAIPSGTTLGSCSVEMSTNGAPGFLVFGKPDPKRTGYVRALSLGDNTLVVQIHDVQENNNPSDNWVHTNHVEIWTAQNLDPGKSLQSQPEMLTQIGVTLDGKVHRGFGNAAFPQVEAWAGTDEQNRPVRVVKLQWKEEFALTYGFLLVYSQADGGKQARMVANGGLTRNRPDYLIGSHAIANRCTIANGRVELLREVKLPLEQEP